MYYTLLIIVSSLISCGYCDDCLLHYKPIPDSKQELLHRIDALKSKRFGASSGGYTYTVTICSPISKSQPNVTATKDSSVYKRSVVLGRSNDTHLVGGSDWILLTYASGDAINNSNHCNTSMKTSVMITCNGDSDQTLFALNDDDAVGDCQVTFTLKTPVLCPKIPRGLSKGSVFCVLLLTGGMMYLIIGVAYRRIMTGAQGVEQIPHYYFWRDLGNLQADGCDFVCRKGNGREEPWSRITSNFNDPADEPLLHP